MDDHPRWAAARSAHDDCRKPRVEPFGPMHRRRGYACQDSLGPSRQPCSPRLELGRHHGVVGDVHVAKDCTEVFPESMLGEHAGA
ncbi:hypothetical protein [Mycobacterium sp. HM-7]